MTREELRKHCEKQIEHCEKCAMAGHNREELHRKVYEEHKLILELLEEPKKGHWISHRDHCRNLGVMPSGLGAYEWCSNCDCGIDVREWHRNHYNYCPKCGAKMESEE